jgi:hypothetical protein
MLRRALVVLVAGLVFACNTGEKTEPKPDPVATAQAPVQQNDAALRLGAPIDATAQKVALADVAKTPDQYVNKTFTTTGTVTAVCQHMGCWMEIKDDASEAHIKMAGHKFFVPKTASGKKARIMAKLVSAQPPAGAECDSEGHEAMAAEAKDGKKGCRAEAEQQLGRPLAKLELEAAGVELL